MDDYPRCNPQKAYVKIIIRRRFENERNVMIRAETKLLTLRLLSKYENFKIQLSPFGYKKTKLDSGGLLVTKNLCCSKVTTWTFIYGEEAY